MESRAYFYDKSPIHQRAPLRWVMLSLQCGQVEGFDSIRLDLVGSDKLNVMDPSTDRAESTEEQNSDSEGINDHRFIN